jgi:serine/threonine-protein kinase
VSGDSRTDGARSDGASTLDLSGRCVGSSYLLLRPIGQGATGTVWRGVDRSTGEQVAVKLLHESLLRQPKLVTRFVQERTILLMLRHRNVVRVRDLFSVGESLGLVMDLVSGGSLRDHLRAHGPIAAGEAARLAAQVAAALTEAHDLGVIHRDLKPDNILLQLQDGRLDTRLTDFGIARVLSTPSLTTSHAVVGTPHYMAPEAFHGAPTSAAADVYALGVLLYELVVGCPPYGSDSVADLMRRHVEDRPHRRAGIPDALWDVITSCMEKKPRLRPSAAELVADLGAVARATAGVPALPHPEPHPPVPGPPAADPLAAADPSAREGTPVPPLRSATAQPPTGGSHPSLPGSKNPVPRPRNQPPAWRWARPWVIVALVGGTVVSTGVATSAWHLSHRADGTRVVTAGEPVALPEQHPQAVPPLNPSAVRNAVDASAPATARSAVKPVIVQARATGTRTGGTAGGPGRAAANGGGIREARPYGPWQCREAFRFSFTDPVLAKPCHALGDTIQVLGQMAAPAGTRATITLSLRNATTGRTVAGPHACRAVTFTGRDLTNDCGPVRMPAAHGRRYVVVLDWTYTRQGTQNRGSARGPEFSW